MDNIANLLNEKELIESRLNKLVYGSIEIRNNNNKKYIYTHYRENGILYTKYAGEYSQELHNLIIENNTIAKELKKRLKIVLKSLNQLDYQRIEISDKVKINIDLARKNLAESIYKQSMLEGIATTYSDTETIVNGGKVFDMDSKDIAKVINLKHAWEFILSDGVIAYPTNFTILCQINSLIEEGFSYTAGKLRSVPVSIGGSTYIPPIPFESKTKEDLENIFNSNLSSLEKAIELLLYTIKSQLFLDGNKRTSVIFANHYLISHGEGLIVVPAEAVNDFKKVLIDFYEGKNDNIKKFIIDKCYQQI